MNILWIDDFDEKKTSEGRVSFVEPFKGFLTEGIQERLDELGKSKIDNAPESLQEILQDNTHPIYWYDGFVSGLDAIVETVPFDFIILDAKMPTDDSTIEKDYQKASCEEKTRNQITFFKGEGVFPKEDDLYAGLTLYFYLVQERGYPRDRVVFLSANIEKAEDIKSNFRAAKVIPPTIFTKDEDGNSKFQKTLEKFSKNEYLNLRRGILDVLTQIQIEKLPTRPPFEENSGDPVNGTAFVKGLEFFLKDHRIPANEEIRHFYLALCDYLTKPFERFDGKKVYDRGKHSYNRPCTEEELKEFNRINSDKEDTECTKPTVIEVDKKYIIPAFLVRNWIAHTLMSSPKSKWDAQDVGFLFMTVVRSLFGYEDSYKYFKPLYSSINRSLNIEPLVAKVVNLQKQHYSKSQGVFDQLSFKGRKDLNLGWPEEDFVGHLYASFLFCCFTRPSETPKVEQVSYKDQQGKPVYRPSYWINYRYDFKDNSDPLFKLLMAVAYRRIEERKF